MTSRGLMFKSMEDRRSQLGRRVSLCVVNNCLYLISRRNLKQPSRFPHINQWCALDELDDSEKFQTDIVESQDSRLFTWRAILWRTVCQAEETVKSIVLYLVTNCGRGRISQMQILMTNSAFPFVPETLWSLPSSRKINRNFAY